MRWNLPPGQMPEAWFNVVPHLPEPLQPDLHPGHTRAGRTRRSRPALPDGPHRPGGDHRALGRHPGRGRRRAPSVAPDPARARRATGEGARDPGADLLQGRVGLAGRIAQAEHRRAAGLLQQAGGHRAARHRDRRRPMGQRPCLRLRPFRPRVQGLHGPGLVQPEALPAHHDGDLGRHRWSPPRSTTRSSPGSLGIGDLRRRARRRLARATPTTRSARCSTTSCCTRPSSGSRPKTSWPSPARRLPDIVIGSCGGGSNLGGISLPFVPDDRGATCSRSSRPPARRSRRARSSTTSPTSPR